MIEQDLQKVDAARVLAASACLQMDLSNLNELLILERLSLSAFRQVTPPGKGLSSSGIRRLLHAEEIGGPDVLAQLDPFEGFPTSKVLYPPHELLAVDGMASESVTIAGRILRAVFADGRSALPREYSFKIHTAAAFLFGLSDALCQAFGRTAMDVAPAPTRQVTVPSAKTLATRAENLIFSKHDLFGERPAQETNFLIANFVATHGDMSRTTSPSRDAAAVSPRRELASHPSETRGPGLDSFLADSALTLTPIVDTHLGFVVAGPTALAASFRHFALSEAHRQGCAKELAEALTAGAIDDATFVLNFITDSPLQRVTVNDPAVPYSAEHSRAQPLPEVARFVTPFDGDKMLDLRLSVDSLQHYDPTSAWGHAYAPAFDGPPLVHPVDSVLAIDCYAGVGRDHMYLGSQRPNVGFFTSLSDLEALVFASDGDRLTPWYFALALRRLLERCRVISFSLLDTLSVFVDHRHSFYLSDGQLPTRVSIEPGSGQELRTTAAAARGPVFKNFDRGVARALSSFGGSSPVSMILADPTVCFINLERLTVWARCSFKSEEHAPTHHVSSHPEHTYAEATAYWLWQIYLNEPDLLTATGGTDNVIVDIEAIWAVPDPESAHERPGAKHLPRSAPSVIVEGVPASHTTIQIVCPTQPYEVSPPNWMDRDVVVALVDALIDLSASETSWPQERRDALLQTVAPPGRKTMLAIRSQNGSPIEWPGSLPQTRRVSRGATAVVLDGIGEHLHRNGFEPGPIADDQRLEVLNKHVISYILDELTAVVTTLDADNATRRLLTEYEALIHEMADDNLRLPETIACFGPDSPRVRELSDSTQRATITSISLRFLIEYVSATPPQGDLHVNDELFDRMLALAAEAVNKGQLSDALRHGVADSDLSVLKSRRLGIEREQSDYSHALEQFQENQGTIAVADATRLAQATPPPEPSLNDDDTGHDELEGLEELNRLATAEYGFSYTQLTDTCGVLIDASRDAGQEDVGELVFDDAVRIMDDRLELGPAQSKKILAALSLRTMENFWAAGVAVYPWTFNRSRSYLRQPLIVQDSEHASPTIVFGHRNLWMTPQHWLERHLQGRLQATSAPMKAAMGAARDAAGTAFERDVRDAAIRWGAAETRTRFTKAGSLDLSLVDGQNLGDIDVVIVTPMGTIVLIEAKCLQVARTPRELSNELQSLVSGKKSAVTRIRNRVAEVAKHLVEVEAELGLPHRKGRSVVAVVITDAPLVGSLLNPTTIPILDIGELPAFLSNADAGTGRSTRHVDRPARDARSVNP